MSFRPVLLRTLQRSVAVARPSFAVSRLSLLRPIAAPTRFFSSTPLCRHEHAHNPAVPTAPTAPAEPEAEQKPSYQLTFTCRPCQERSTHTISKQAYHSGSVLVQCPGCKNRHVITDHLKIFGETARTLEQILAESGEVLKRARMLGNGDMEILPEGVEMDYIKGFKFTVG